MDPAIEGTATVLRTVRFCYAHCRWSAATGRHFIQPGNPSMKTLRLLAGTALLAACTLANAAAYDGLYVFGDSLSDSGNNALVIGTDPGQVITGNSYIPTFPYASGQYSNGDVWARTFASAIGLAAYGAPSLAGGGDYAYGGARTRVDGSAGGFPPSVKSQVTSFLGAVGGVASGDSLYVVASGGNDARDALEAISVGAPIGATLVKTALSYAIATHRIVDRLQAAGAEHIIVWNVPDLGLAPAVTAEGGLATTLGHVVSSFMNVALGKALAGEVGVQIFDTYGLLNAVVADPAAYGLTNVTDACGNVAAGCDPLTSLFWDGIHPTSAGHALLAGQMLAIAVPEPETFALMLGGLALVVVRARRAV